MISMVAMNMNGIVRTFWRILGLCLRGLLFLRDAAGDDEGTKSVSAVWMSCRISHWMAKLNGNGKGMIILDI